MHGEKSLKVIEARSNVVTVFALCLSLILVSCGNALSVGNESTQAIAVRSLEQLSAALEKAETHTVIAVAPGTYPTLQISGKKFDGPVIIRSADEARPAIFEGFSIKDSRGIMLENIAIRPPADGNGLVHYGAQVINSSEITIDGMSFIGPPKDKAAPYSTAIMLRLSSSVTLSRSYFANFRHGVMLLDMRGSRIALNEFEFLQIDAIRGGGVSDTKIENNVITNFFPAKGDHPDGIQLWSTNQKNSGRNLVIAENLVARGQGGPIQGIFLRDENRRLPYETVEIRRNMVLGGMYNGITVDGGHKVLVHDNIVLGRSDQKSWIRLQRVREARSSNNIAQQFLSLDNEAEPQQFGNLEAGAVDTGQAQLIRNWVSRSKGFDAFRGPVLRRLMAGS